MIVCCNGHGNLGLRITCSNNVQLVMKKSEAIVHILYYHVVNSYFSLGHNLFSLHYLVNKQAL
jgi:hypothetical protein